MTEQDRAFRALSLKIVDELRVHVRAYIERGLSPGDPGFRSAAETLNAAAEGALSRYLPRLPVELPAPAVLERVFEERPDVFADPSRFDTYDPKADPLLVLHSMVVRQRLPLDMSRCGAFLRIADHYRPSIMAKL